MMNEMLNIISTFLFSVSIGSFFITTAVQFVCNCFLHKKKYIYVGTLLYSLFLVHILND